MGSGDPRSDQRVGHGDGQPNALEGVARLQLGAGGDDSFEARAERAVHRAHHACGTLQAAGDRLQRAGVSQRLGDPFGHSRAQRFLPGDEQLAPKALQRLFVATVESVDPPSSQPSFENRNVGTARRGGRTPQPPHESVSGAQIRARRVEPVDSVA